jgi:hypothetical protein
LSRASRWSAVAILVLVTLASPACDDAVPYTGEATASAIPDDVTMVAGARHDVLVAACVDSVSWADVLTPVVVTGFFVSQGRLDAAFYLPEAVAASLIPNCEPVEFDVTDASVDGAGFSLEPTENPAAYRVRSTGEGEATFRADVRVRGETLQVETRLQAVEPDTVSFSPRCDFDEQAGGRPVAEHLFQAESSAEFSYSLERDGKQLAGYDFSPFDSEAIELRPSTSPGPWTYIDIIGEPGEYALRTAYDPDFAFDFRIIDRSEFDALELGLTGDSSWFVGQERAVQALLTLEGELPCQHTQGLELEIETPEVCAVPSAFTPETISTYPRAFVGLAAGTCRITVSLPEAGLNATFETIVHPAFEPVQVEGRGETELTHLWVEEGEYFVGAAERAELRRDDAYVIHHTVNGAWQTKTLPSHLLDLGGASGQVFAVGEDALVLQFDGAQWIEHDIAGAPEAFHRVWVRAPDDVFVAGQVSVFHFDGTSWSIIESATDDLQDPVRDIFAADGGPLFVLHQTLYRYDGSQWHDELVDFPEHVGNFRSPTQLVARAGDDIWLSGHFMDGRVLKFDGVRWESVAIGHITEGLEPHFTAIWPVRGVEEAFFMRADSYNWAAHYNGRTLQQFDRPIPSKGVTVTGEGDDVFILSHDRIFKTTYVPTP